METVLEKSPQTRKKQRTRKQKQRTNATKVPETKLTLEQAEKLAAGRPYELINGRMIFKMGDDKHADVQALLGAELVNYLKANPVGIMRTEFTHRLWPDRPHEARMPDLAIILNENLNRSERYATKAPDIAIEIISRDDLWTELFEKAELYLEKGSQQVWIVDPYQQAVVVVTPDDRQWIKNTLTAPDILPGLEIKIPGIFSWQVTTAKAKK